jgi:hypothetical protein
VSFATVTLCVASRRVFIVVYLVIDSVRKLLDIPSYVRLEVSRHITGVNTTYTGVRIFHTLTVI